MAGGHILVLQMQRLGDMIMSYPLLIWLTRLYPRQPLWVVGEPGFYQELLPVSPPAYYVPWTDIDTLPVVTYDLIVNLSHRPEAAALAGRLPSQEAIGAVAEPDGAVRVRGFWQLYLSSIVHNNRHNRFHFAELWALDAVPLATMAQTHWLPPRESGDKPVGLFLGASQEHKRPGVEFWAALARELSRRGRKPILLGGPSEADFGREVNAASGLNLTDLCGRTTLSQLIAVMAELSLVVTPDTGPMHAAALTGTLTLNLSLGPVSPWETGPYQPGHYVLRPERSCRGCWGCRRATPACIMDFDPQAVAVLAGRLLRQGEEAAAKVQAPGLGLYRTGRNENGLYDLRRISPERRENAADLLGALWSAVFLHFAGQADRERAARAMAGLREKFPKTAAAFARALPLFGARLKKGMASPLGARGDDFWRASPPMLRPFTGYAQMRLQNEDFSRPAFGECLRLFETLAGLCLEG
jgi:ADP-heptose:LPS heptosyltransferase